jgi:dTDP-4-dehydrorhamnose 3,5-epimerase
LGISEVILVEAAQFPDARGSFWESYKHSAFADHGMEQPFVQDNCSHSTRGVLRGLHYQKSPASQAKLVGPVAGEIFDVAVDIRRGSPTFGRWVGARLAAGQMLFVPTGFAHGFCVLSAEAIVYYKTTAEYASELDRGIIWNDPSIGIDWPVRNPILSGKDQQLPLLTDADNNFVYSP